MATKNTDKKSAKQTKGKGPAKRLLIPVKEK